MSFPRSLHGLLLSLLLAGVSISAIASGGCGSSSPSTAATGSTGSTGTGGTGAGGSTSATSTTGTGGGVSCGPDLVCDSGKVCIVDDFDPPCGPVPEDGGACAPGETMTQCGGAGFPCCCGQPPPSTYRCAPLAGCGAPSCDCLGTVCAAGKICEAIGGKPDEFHCVSPPMP